MKLRNTIIVILSIAILVLLYLPCNHDPEVIVETNTVKITEYEDSIVFIEKEVPVYLTKTIKVPTETKKEVINEETHTYYSDTSFLSDDFYLFYDADVVGRLFSVDLGYYDNRQDSMRFRTITNTVTNTVTKTVNPRGLYIGSQLNTMGSIIPSAAYQWNKNFVISGYDVRTKSINVGYLRKF